MGERPSRRLPRRGRQVSTRGVWRLVIAVVAVAAVVFGMSVPAYAASAFTAAPTPTITGAAVVGQTLTANAGAWAPTPDAVSYQWNRAGAAITGATASSYLVTSADSGKALTVTVTATKSDFVTTAKSSITWSVGTAFTTAPTPTITGSAAVGSTLTAAAGTWAPVADSTRYQWNRNGVPILGANAATYALVAADAGTSIALTVTSAKAGYATTSKTSAAKAVALGSFTTAPTPTITGTAAVGSTLTATAGAWSPTPVR